MGCEQAGETHTFAKLCSPPIQGLNIVAISESSISLPFLNFANPHQRIWPDLGAQSVEMCLSEAPSYLDTMVNALQDRRASWQTGRLAAVRRLIHQHVVFVSTSKTSNDRIDTSIKIYIKCLKSCCSKLLSSISVSNPRPLPSSCPTGAHGGQ